MYYQNKKCVLEALRIANNLMCVAGNGDTLGDCGSSGILLGVMRDCACKIRRHAENEEHKAKLSFTRSYTMLVIFAAALLSIVFASPVNATTIILSTDDTEIQGGLTFDRDDLAEYNPTTNDSTLYFNGDLFSGTTDIDAVHILDNDNIILSTIGNATLGGLSFDIGDLVEYNPTTDTATLYFDQDLFSQSENIDAAFILDSGNIILSTVGDATLGGLSFEAGDLAEYNPTTDTATLYFDADLFSGIENIDAVHILDSGNIVLSTVDVATLGGLSFTCGDLVEYNPTTDVATLHFDENNFTGSANINAVYVTTLPEPTMIALLGLGSLVLVGRKRS
jgi:hypothetical protein